LDATYTPSASETNGTVTLTLTTDDPTGPCEAVSDSMVITINRAPSATNDTISRNNGTNGTKVSIALLLSNDSDPDGDVLSLSGFSSLSAQGATISSNGAFLVYTTTNSINVNDSFTYTNSDGFGGTSVGTVAVTVTGANVQSRQITLVATNDQFAGSFFGVLSTPYTVQYTTNLNSDWETLTNVTTSTNGIGLFSDPGPFSPERYYRIVYP
jgi:hypothetical protein